MAIDLNACDETCFGCIKNYKKKHDLKIGQDFKIGCKGIPKDFVPLNILAGLAPKEHAAATAMLDPVTWASETLDWHCLDPDGAVWKRKNPDEYWEWMELNPEGDILGCSRYHRPYQAEMLRCSSKQKLFRIGRQAGKTEAIVVSMLFHMFTKPGVAIDSGFKIIVITPYQSQIDLIFERMKELIKTSPTTLNSVKRSVKAPVYTIELHNGSMVKGFTAGTKSGGNAEAVRGQHGHMLVFDEADYLNTGDMDAAFSIITNHPNASVWMSSTPSGKREKFYQTSRMKEWKEFHWSSRVNPMWDERKEALMRGQLTAIGFKHEVLADFGEQEEGVFQNAYVQAARQEFEYGANAFRKSWTYTVGVDWNDTKNGTTIAVLGHDPRRQKFILVDRYIVSRDGWTQLAACQKIAEVNRLWMPAAIYLDAGFGGTQWEVLRKYGYDSIRKNGATHPDSRLPRVLKQYDFGSKIDTKDLFTGLPLKKDAKPFLVESTIRRFEQQDLIFPKSDTDLEKQLLGYVIDRITPTGRPVYKASVAETGDHMLDALMLSVVAFILEETPFGKAQYDTGISFSGQFGERTEALAGKGDTVVHRNVAHKEQEKRDNRQPAQNRTSTMEQQSLFADKNSLPANHTHHRENKVGLWPNQHDMSNWSADRPIHKVRSFTEAENDARRRMGIRVRKGSRPRRKNI